METEISLQLDFWIKSKHKGWCYNVSPNKEKEKDKILTINYHKEDKAQYIIIRSLSMTNWLCRNGHDILKVSDSEIDSRFKVFLFQDTAALHNTMKQFPKKEV